MNAQSTMKVSPLASELAASLSRLDNERGKSLDDSQYARKRACVLSQLTSKTGLSSEQRTAFIIILNAVIIGAATIAGKLPADIVLTYILPIGAAAAVVLALRFWRLERRQRLRLPERIDAVEHLLGQSHISASEAEGLMASIDAQRSSESPAT